MNREVTNAESAVAEEAFALAIGASRTAEAPTFAVEILEELADLNVSPGQVELVPGNAGYGADWPTIVLLIAGVFVLGKPIDENLQAWRNIGARLFKTVKKLRTKHRLVLVSQPAALVLAVRLLESRGVDVDGMKLVSGEIIPVVYPDLRDFRHQPHRFYVFVFRDAGADVFIVCLRSTGELEFIQQPGREWAFLNVPPR